MKKIAIVTVNYNTADETKKLLVSLEKIKKDTISLEVIVVDNGSKERLVLDPKDFSYQLQLLYSEENTGFTGGYNRGIRQALVDGAEYLLLINNDTIVDPLVLTKLLEPFETDKKIGITVPKIYFARGHEFHKGRYTEKDLGRVFWYAGGAMDWDHVMSRHRGVDEVDHGQYDVTEQTGFATGCCLLVKREVFKKAGLFADNYFLYFEDADFTQRVKQLDYDILYVPAAIIWHSNAGSSGSGGELHDYFLTRNRMLFGMKYAPLRTKIALVRESIRLLNQGRPFQKKGIQDFYLRKFGKGSFFD
ncbi:MAG: glycosyltransferase family 2 protein [Patescibacteria group bacterium]